MLTLSRGTFLIIILFVFKQSSCLAVENTMKQPTLRTGFYLLSFPDIAAVDMEVALRFWTEEVGKEVGIVANVYIYKDLQKMRDDFDQKKINFIVASPLIIAKNFDLNKLTDGYKVVLYGNSADNLLVVSHKQSQLDDFTKVKNQRLSLLSNEPISKLYLELLTQKYFAENSRKIFKNTEYIRNSNRLIYQLFFKKTDIILVYQAAYNIAVELNPQIGQQTQVIASLAGIPRGLGFFHHQEDPAFREKVLTEVEKLGNHARGQQLMALFSADEIKRSTLADLNTTRKLMRDYEQQLKLNKK